MKDDYIEKLIEGAGKRPTPDDKTTQDIFLATKQAWQESVRQNKMRILKKRIVAFNVAAVMLVGLWGVWQWSPLSLDNSRKEVGDIIFADSNYQLNDTKQNLKSKLHVGDTLSSNTDSVVSVVLFDNTQITFAPNTSMQFTGISTMHLLSGRVFVDSPDQNTSVVIDTQWGSIQDIGTQFEVTVSNEELKVAMREGKVKMDLGNSVEYANYQEGSGDVVYIDRDKNVSREKISSTDQYWNWTTPAIKALKLEDTSLFDTLHWVGRVTGKKINYNSVEISQLAKETHFSSGRLEADMIDTVLPTLFKTTTLNVKIDPNKITVTHN